MTDTTRIDALKNILLQLHHGATPESVQEEFNRHFTGVSAIEISLMEHELMNGGHGIQFEDVMKLCNVHAQLFKNAVDSIELSESEKAGHPVAIFKQENLALRAALLRIRRLIDTIQSGESESGLLNGLKRQLTLLGQFDRHYRRKEELFFPLMEKYGHDAPPKVMWGVDDQIRALFQTAQQLATQLPASLTDFVPAYDQFEHEFKEMIFKEEAILIPLLLSLLSEDDWLAIAAESDEYGYAIITPEEKWQPERQTLASATLEAAQKATAATTTTASSTTLTTERLAFGGGYLTIKEANLLLNHLPFELTFINRDDVFQYFNTSIEQEAKLFPRTASAVGRHVKNCHPPRSLEMVLQLIDDLKHQRRSHETMWFHNRKGQFVYVNYIGVFDEDNVYQGILEYVYDIQPLVDLAHRADKRTLANTTVWHKRLPYTVLCFDLDHTLWDTDASQQLAFTTICNELALPYSEELYQAFRTYNKQLWRQLEQGLISKVELMQRRFKVFFQEQFGEQADAYDGFQLDERYRELLVSQHQNFAGALELLHDLKAAGYRLIAATNGVAKTQTHRLQQAQMTELFEHVFISESLGVEKPAAAFFHKIQTALGELPVEALLMIGDSLSSDIQGANNSGIDCVWYNPHLLPLPKAQHAHYIVANYQQLRHLLLD